jgi:hypothetical protein
MTSAELENLVRIDKLKRERYSAREFRGLVSSAEARLSDAADAKLTLDSRFDLAYNAAHALDWPHYDITATGPATATSCSRYFHIRSAWVLRRFVCSRHAIPGATGWSTKA